MAYILHDHHGNEMAGDSQFEENMKSMCDELSGYVTNEETGELVYDARYK